MKQWYVTWNNGYWKIFDFESFSDVQRFISLTDLQTFWDEHYEK